MDPLPPPDADPEPPLPPLQRRRRRSALSWAAPAPAAAPSRGAGPTLEEAHVLLAGRNTHVTKTLWPPQGGTVQCLAEHGLRLVCVRYRQDAHRLCRFTTVELVVDAAWLPQTRLRRHRLEVDLGYDEVELRRWAQALGARWDPDQRIWYVSAEAAQTLHLAHRIRPGRGE
ncbi:DUF5710 domain-containing protein [Rubrivivax sp. RP6-9]|uniref:DUF5710 domain-containing protein n=1 Tax=Rubrivivax sp. RP6-9 TaxID=3415750 RepID=UPI003CC527B7